MSGKGLREIKKFSKSVPGYVSGRFFSIFKKKKFGSLKTVTLHLRQFFKTTYQERQRDMAR
jgi:hypothetical protein